MILSTDSYTHTQIKAIKNSKTKTKVKKENPRKATLDFSEREVREPESKEMSGKESGGGDSGKVGGKWE